MPYLILADVQNTVLSALLTFSDRVLYPYYTQVPRLAGISALDDQAAAGVIMWVPGSVAFLVPLFAIGVRLLYGESEERDRGVGSGSVSSRKRQDRASRYPSVGASLRPSTVAARPAVSTCCACPLLGRFLRWRHARLALQLPLVVLAGVVIVDGLRGPQVGAMNLAGVLPWIHWRGLLILGLLAAGNFFCMACPVHAAADAGPPLAPAGLALAALAAKQVAGGRSCSSCSSGPTRRSPSGTAPGGPPGSSSATSSAAFVVDGFFRGASFCKYVCPIGQFNFVQSLVSPLEVKVRDPDVCATCRTKDCIRGRDGIPGCELHLFQPRKAGNMDCTFCLDCVHACPHDNVGMLAAPGQRSVARPRPLRRRPLRPPPDLAALILVLVFGAFANAAGMVGPVVDWQSRLPFLLGQRSPLLADEPFLYGRPGRSAGRGGRRGGRPEPRGAVGELCWRRRLATRLPWCRWASACGWRITVSTS